MLTRLLVVSSVLGALVAGYVLVSSSSDDGASTAATSAHEAPAAGGTSTMGTVAKATTPAPALAANAGVRPSLDGSPNDPRRDLVPPPALTVTAQDYMAQQGYLEHSLGPVHPRMLMKPEVKWLGNQAEGDHTDAEAESLRKADIAAFRAQRAGHERSTPGLMSQHALGVDTMRKILSNQPKPQ